MNFCGSDDGNIRRWQRHVFRAILGTNTVTLKRLMRYLKSFIGNNIAGRDWLPEEGCTPWMLHPTRNADDDINCGFSRLFPEMVIACLGAPEQVTVTLTLSCNVQITAADAILNTSYSSVVCRVPHPLLRRRSY